jgi:hypothetical protein
MKQASGSGQSGLARVKVTAGTADDLPAIVGILNYTAARGGGTRSLLAAVFHAP